MYVCISCDIIYVCMYVCHVCMSCMYVSSYHSMPVPMHCSMCSDFLKFNFLLQFLQTIFIFIFLIIFLNSEILKYCPKMTNFFYIVLYPFYYRKVSFFRATFQDFRPYFYYYILLLFFTIIFINKFYFAFSI